MTKYKAEVLRLVAEASVGKVVGARILVKDVEPVDEVQAWAKRTGLHAVTYEKNRPGATEGVVLAVGSDPLVQEEVEVGDHVFFSKFAGHNVYEEGKEYRSLELQEITRVKPRAFYGWDDTPEQASTPLPLS